MCEGEMREQTEADTVPVECDKGAELKLSGDVFGASRYMISAGGNI
jgi:hypothetical protein